MTALEKFDAAVTAYLTNKRFRGLSPATLDNYTETLSGFRSWWTERHGGEPETDPSYTDILEYRNSLVGLQRAESTVRSRLVDLRAFFAAFEKAKLVPGVSYPENPVDKDFFPYESKRPYDQILTDDQVQRLLSPEKPKNGKASVWPRNYAILSLLLSAKIRSDELRSLTLADLDFREEVIVVSHGKGDKYREIDFPPFAQAAVLLYLQSGLRPETLPDTALLFGFGPNWEKGTRQNLHTMITRLVKDVTGVEGVGPHDLRHIGARLELNAGASMEALQAELGHSQITTTKIYTGRLQTRRGRKTAAQVLEEMNRIAVQNMDKATANLAAARTAG